MRRPSFPSRWRSQKRARPSWMRRARSEIREAAAPTRETIAQTRAIIAQADMVAAFAEGDLPRSGNYPRRSQTDGTIRRAFSVPAGVPCDGGGWHGAGVEISNVSRSHLAALSASSMVVGRRNFREMKPGSNARNGTPLPSSLTTGVKGSVSIKRLRVCSLSSSVIAVSHSIEGNRSRAGARR
jgi:hypothetical protein